MKLDLEGELNRLRHGAPQSGTIPGLGSVRFIAKSPHPDRVLARVKQVLELVFEHGLDDHIETSTLADKLPEWFSARFFPELTEQEEARFERLLQSDSATERAAIKERWSVVGWLYWFRPSMREWFWWDAEIVDPNHVLVAVAVFGWPFPWGSLRQLFLACGADDLAPTE